MTVYPEIHLTKARNGNARHWRVTEDVQCRDYDGEAYVIYEGFVSNFASVPSFLYLFFNPHGRSAIPAIKHDYRYEHLVGLDDRKGHSEARRAADRQFYYDLLDEGMGKFGAYTMYLGVRSFGWYKWIQHALKMVIQLRKVNASIHH